MIRKFWRVASSISTAWSLTPAILSNIILTIFTAILGFLSEIQLFWIVVGTSVVFSTAITAILRFSEWVYFNDIKNRFIFEKLLCEASAAKGAAGNEYHFVQFTVVMRNRSHHTIYFNFDELHSDFFGRITPQKEMINTGGYLPPEDHVEFKDAPIMIFDDIPSGQAVGTVKFRISYWREGAKKYQMERKFHVSTRLDKNDSAILTYFAIHDT